MELDARIRELHTKRIAHTVAAELLGICRKTLARKIAELGLDWPKGIPGGGTVVDGVRDSLERHALKRNMTPGRLAWLMQNKQPLNTPAPPAEPTPEEARAFTELRRQGVPAWEAATRMGRPYETIRKAALRYCPDYRGVVKNAPRVRRSTTEIAAGRPSAKSPKGRLAKDRKPAVAGVNG